MTDSALRSVARGTATSPVREVGPGSLPGPGLHPGEDAAAAPDQGAAELLRGGGLAVSNVYIVRIVDTDDRGETQTWFVGPYGSTRLLGRVHTCTVRRRR